jgi:hypothetical protein
MDANEQVTLELIAERLRGLDRVTTQGFKGLDDKFETVKDLPVIVERLATKQEAQDKRLVVLETGEERSFEWRRGQLPTLVLTLLVVIVGAIQVFH